MASNFGQHYHLYKTTSNATNKLYVIFQNVVWSWDIWRGSDKRVEVRKIKVYAGAPICGLYYICHKQRRKVDVTNEVRRRSDNHELVDKLQRQ